MSEMRAFVLEDQIKTASKEAEKMVASYKDSRTQAVLKEIFNSVIEGRIAMVLGNTERQEKANQKIDHLYTLLPSIGLKKEEAGEKSRSIVAIIELPIKPGEGKKSNAPQKSKKSRRW